MSTETQVIAIEEISADKAPSIYGHNKLSAYVEVARAASNEVPDLTTRKGRERVASLAAQVSRSKTAVEKPGREYLKRIKELPKAIEAELRDFVQQMDSLRDEVRKPLTEWEEAEEARVNKHEANVDALKSWGTPSSQLSAAELRDSIVRLEQVEIGAEWEEFEAEAHRVKAASLATLREALAKREKYEAEQAELERLRAEAVARAQKEREERIAREAAEAERLAAERRVQEERDAANRREAEAKAAAERRELELKLAAEQAEREKVEAQRRAEQAERDAQARAEQAAAAERQRQADEQARIKAEAEAREADRAHKGAVLKAAKEAVMTCGITEDQAREVIKLIAAGGVPRVCISY
ncbi:hypothetical protein ACUTAF_01905 [Pseudomonas sp. SP16.1]|uniref:hypothetical protein n=1 Tax=Pseudomonas sp. SP16.1 TaxID=3458854 RepID=UPI00404559CB